MEGKGIHARTVHTLKGTMPKPAFIGQYTLTLDPKAKISQITLPNNPKVKVLAVTLQQAGLKKKKAPVVPAKPLDNVGGISVGH